MFNAKESLKWSEEVKGCKRRGKLRMQKASSRIKRKTQEEIENFTFMETQRKEKNKIKSVEKRKMAKTGKNVRMNQENQEEMN